MKECDNIKIITVSIIYLFIYLFLLAIRKNTIHNLMWWLYKVRYDTTYYNDVV